MHILLAVKMRFSFWFVYLTLVCLDSGTTTLMAFWTRGFYGRQPHLANITVVLVELLAKMMQKVLISILETRQELTRTVLPLNG